MATTDTITSLDAVSGLKEEILRENYNYWIAQWSPLKQPAADTSQILQLVPTTHTFSYEKRWGDSDSEHRYPYKEILFEDRALLSEHSRSARWAANEPRRNMSRARRVGLDHFVSAYLGVHDPYYATQPPDPKSTKPKPIPATLPFGVFLPPDSSLESFPKCNVTHRDLNAGAWPPDREFLLPSDGRTLAAYEVANSHNGDLWHYWGSDGYWIDPNYASTSWTWKLEFHYRNLVDVKSFSAVLWPNEIYAVRAGVMSDSLADNEAATFKRANPNCAVIPYQWSSARPALSFIQASYAVVRYFSFKGEYPSNADEARRLMDP